MFSKHTIEEIMAVAGKFGLEPAALLAICSVESGGRVFARIGERREPLIRFEGHYFDRRLTDAKRRRARNLGLASPKVGAIVNPRNQSGRWALFRRAEEIDRRAARESVSWGLGQVMGAHWAWLGYANVDALVAEARSGAAGQTRIMARYILKAGLAPAIAARDWKTFARGYNGPAYRKYRYDTRIAAAYRQFAKTGGSPGPGRPEPAAPAGGKDIGIGARGAAVEALQHALTAAGYPATPDGVFGPGTERALRQFQQRAGLVITARADKATLAALRKTRPFSALARRIVQWIRSRLFFSSGG